MCRGREFVWAEADARMAELDKATLARQEIVADLAAARKTREEVREIVAAFGL